MANLAECGSLGVRELGASIQLGLQDAVFGGQIFVARQQLLVHRPRDVSQDPRPIHMGPIASTVRDGVIDRPPKCSGPPRAPPYWPGITHRLLGSFSFLTLRDRIMEISAATPEFLHATAIGAPDRDQRAIITVAGQQAPVRRPGDTSDVIHPAA